MPAAMDWNDATIARLRALWHAGHPTSAIGLLLKCSKNTVVGKAHRLRLPPRPSPIRRGRPPIEGAIRAATPPQRKGRVTLPPLRSVVAPAAPLALAMPPPIAGPIVAALPRQAPLAPPQAPLAIARAPRRAHPCCWPLGDPRRPSFRFCEKPVLAGNYCGEHAMLARGVQRETPRSWQRS